MPSVPSMKGNNLSKASLSLDRSRAETDKQAWRVDVVPGSSILQRNARRGLSVVEERDGRRSAIMDGWQRDEVAGDGDKQRRAELYD